LAQQLKLRLQLMLPNFHHSLYPLLLFRELSKSAQFDKDVIKRIEDIQQLDDDTQNKLFFLIDNIVQNFKTKQAFAK
jgi:hypothetical protein